MEQKMDRIVSIMIGTFAVFLLAIYPLVTDGSYTNLGIIKYTCLKYLIIIGLSLIAVMAALGNAFRETGKVKLGTTDILMAAYGVLAIVSWAGCSHRDEGFNGAEGWYMGLLSQLMFVAVYFVISLSLIHKDIAYGTVIAAVMLSATVVTAIGILQGCGVDVGGWYSKEYFDVRGEFFTTMGQTSWYSAYLTLENVFAAFLLVNVLDKNSSIPVRISRKGWTVICLVFEAVSLTALIMLKAQAGYGAIVITAVVALWYMLEGRHNKYILGKRIAIAGAIAIMLAVVFGICNTMGWFGTEFRGLDGILYFDEAWGNQRGIIWKHSFDVWKSLSFGDKLWGIGPDCYQYAAYSVDITKLNHYMPSVTLMNAHNEWFNSIICYGLVGGMAYAGLFVSALVENVRVIIRGKGNVVNAGVMTAVLVYVFHGFFGYQQYYSTPIIFMIMAMSRHYCRSISDNNC